MTDDRRKRGRPKGEVKVRDSRVSAYLTKEDAEYIREVAENFGFASTSEMLTAILERLCVGGFSAMVFARLGWQFANLPTKKKATGYYLDLRPLPPLLGAEPNPRELTKHLDAVKKELKEGRAEDGISSSNS